MLSAIRCIAVSLAAGLVLIAVPSFSTAQEAGSTPVLTAAGELPEAPQPQFAVASAEPAEAQAISAQNPGTPQPAPGSTPAPVPGPESSSSQSPAAQSDSEKSEHEKAEEQLKEQERQRVAGLGCGGCHQTDGTGVDARSCVMTVSEVTSCASAS